MPALLSFAWPAVLLLLGISIVAAGIYTWRKSSLTRSWVLVDAEVLHSAVGSEDVDGWRPIVSYRYTFDGRQHEGSQFRFVVESMSRSAALEIVARFPTGHHVSAYVNPTKPAEAVLEPGAEHAAALLFLVVGSCLTAYGIYEVLRIP